jgi:hypothetical protein
MTEQLWGRLVPHGQPSVADIPRLPLISSKIQLRNDPVAMNPWAVWVRLFTTRRPLGVWADTLFPVPNSLFLAIISIVAVWEK